jgi:PAS domain S-box-containing protein
VSTRQRKPGSESPNELRELSLVSSQAFEMKELAPHHVAAPKEPHPSRTTSKSGTRPLVTRPDPAFSSEDDELLSVTLNCIADGVITADAFGKVRRINPIAERLTGWDAAHAIGRPLAEVFCVGASPRSGEPLGHLSGSGTHSSVVLDPITLLDRRGVQHSVEMSASAIQDAASESYGTIIIFRDVTRRQELEAKKVQSDKLQAVSQLVGGLAHEFNNLLAGTMNFAELLRLRLGTTDGDASQYAEGIIENTRRASGLVGRLLAFACERPRESVPVDVHGILEELVDDFSAECSPQLRILNHLDATDSFVQGDAQALRESLLNLLTNACEASGISGTIEVRTKIVQLDDNQCRKAMLPVKRGRYLCVEVRDHGKGIPQHLLGRIFEPFFTTKRRDEAAGLGLSVVYGTIRDHAGNIEVETQSGQGTAIRLYLPSPLEVPLESLRPSHQVIQGKGRLLLADDEPSLRRSTGALLRRLGYDVVLAEDGAQALAIFRADPTAFDLVLLDIIMPRMNGREALREMRRIAPGVKAMYVSAFGLSSEDPTTEDGVEGVIRKPFTAAVISQRLADVLEIRA